MQITLTDELSKKSIRNLTKEHISFLNCIPIEKLAGIVAITTLKMFMKTFIFDRVDKVNNENSEKIVYAHFMSEMGNAFERIYKASQKEYMNRNITDTFKELSKRYIDAKHNFDYRDENNSKSAKIYIPNENDLEITKLKNRPIKQINYKIKGTIGSYLTQVVMNTLLDNREPILVYKNQRESKKLKGYLEVKNGYSQKITVF